MAVTAPADDAVAEASCTSYTQFEAFLQTAELGADMPDELAQQIISGLRRRFDAPPVPHLEACMGRTFTLAEARQLLFSPDAEDMRMYPRLLALPSPDTAAQDHPQVSRWHCGRPVCVACRSPVC